jgi:hypothetical protein
MMQGPYGEPRLLSQISNFPKGTISSPFRANPLLSTNPAYNLTLRQVQALFFKGNKKGRETGSASAAFFCLYGIAYFKPRKL